jgi:hypothetical protein
VALALALAFALTACQTRPPDPDRDYEPAAGGVSGTAYRTLRKARGRVFLYQGALPGGFLRLLRVQRAASSPMVQDGSRDDVVVTFQRTGLFGGVVGGGLLGTEDDEQYPLFVLLKNDADAAHLYFRATGDWHRKLKKGKVSPEYKKFWTEPKPSKVTPPDKSR